MMRSRICPSTWHREPLLRRRIELAVSIDAAQIKQLRAELGPAAIAKRLGIARSSVYRALA
jgi:transposase-like protein